MGLDKLQLAQTRQLFENRTLGNSKTNLISTKNPVQRGKKNVRNEKKKVISIRRCLNRIYLCRQIVTKKRNVRRQRASVSKNEKTSHKRQKKKEEECPKRFNVKGRRDKCCKIVTRNSSKPCDKFKFGLCIGHRDRKQSRTLTKKAHKKDRHVKKKKSVRIRESSNRIAVCRNTVATKLARCRNNSHVPDSKKILVSKERKSFKKIKKKITQSKSCSSSIKRKRRARRSFICRKRIKRKRALFHSSSFGKAISTRPRRMKCVRKQKSESWSSFTSFYAPVVTRGMSRNFQTWQENMSTNNNILQNISFAKSYVRAWNLRRGQAAPGIKTPQMRTISTPYQASSIFQRLTSSPPDVAHRPLLTLTSLPALLSTEPSVSFQQTQSTALESVPSSSRVGANYNNLWNSYPQSYFQPTYNQNHQTFDGITKTPTDYRMLRMFGGSCSKTNFSAGFNVSKESSLLAIKTKTLTHELSSERNTTSLCLKQNTMSSSFVTNFNAGSIRTNGDSCGNLKTDLKAESKYINRNFIPESDGYTVPTMSSYLEDSSSKEVRRKEGQEHQDVNYDIKTENSLELDDRNCIELPTTKSHKLANIVRELERTSKNKYCNFNIKSEISNNASLCIQNSSEGSTKNMNAFTCMLERGNEIENSKDEVSGGDENNSKKLSSDCSNSRDTDAIEVTHHSDLMFSANKNKLKSSSSPRININEEIKEMNLDNHSSTKDFKIGMNPFSFDRHAWRDVNTNTLSPSISFSNGKNKESQSEINRTNISVQNQKELMYFKHNYHLKRITKEDPFVKILPKSIRSNRKFSDQVKNDSERMDSAKAVDLNSFNEQGRKPKHSTNMNKFNHFYVTKTENNMWDNGTSQFALNQVDSHEGSSTQFSANVSSISPYDLQSLGKKVKDIEEYCCTAQKSCLCRKKSGQICTNGDNEVTTHPAHLNTQNASVQVDLIDRNSGQVKSHNEQHIHGEANDIEYHSDPLLRFSLGSCFVFSNPIYNDISSSNISSESEIRSSSNSTEDSSCHDSSENLSLESVSSTSALQSVSESSETCSSSENSNLDEISLKSQESVSTQDSYSSDEIPTSGTGNVVIRTRLSHRSKDASSSDSAYVPSSSSGEGDSPFLGPFLTEGALRYSVEEAKQLESEVLEQMDERLVKDISANARSGTHFNQFESGCLYWLKQNRGNMKATFGVNDSNTRTVLHDSINVSEDDHFKSKEVSETYLERQLKPNPILISQTDENTTKGFERSNDQEYCEGHTIQSIPENHPVNLITINCAHSPKRVSEHECDCTEDPQLEQLSTNRILAHIGLNVHASEMAIESTVSPNRKVSSNAYHRILSLCGYRS